MSGWLQTSAGPVPRVRSDWAASDRLGALAVRLGIGRDRYRIAPGLYALGEPDAQSPVIVTCNYKLTFDILRRDLAGPSCWLLVIETYGINVWCAAGKRSFSTEEVAARVRATGLERIVEHRRLVLPQLAAPGVAARKLRGLCGFGAVFGPVRSRDLPAFLEAGFTAEPSMRRAEFPLGERLTVALVEMHAARKFMVWTLALCLVLAALGPAWKGGFSALGLLASGLGAFAMTLAGFVGGTFATPALLRLLPGRAFAAKGLLAGAAIGLPLAVLLARSVPEGLAALSICAAFSSWFAMHYTGSTPFTSLSGVDREMRRYMPAQGLLALLAVVLWLGWSWFGGPAAGGS